LVVYFFFFQAEDGIRDRNVTGVQTCALPICSGVLLRAHVGDAGAHLRYVAMKPRKGLPGRVVDLLLDGPSDALESAVRNPLGGKVALQSNVDTASDGALTVPLSGVGDASKKTKKRMVAQLVNSLREVQTFQVRPLSGGDPLIATRRTWRPSNLPAYSASSSLSSEASGVFVADDRVFSLADGNPVPGGAG